MSRWLLLAVLALAGCQQQPRVTVPHVFTVAELVPQVEKRDQQIVRLRGYLHNCPFDTCGIYQNAAEKPRVIAAERATFQNHARPDPKIPVIYATRLNGVIANSGLIGREVVITGRITKLCRRNGKIVCNGDYFDLIPLAVEPDKIAPRPA